MAAFATPSDLATIAQRDVDTSTASLLLDLASAAVRGYCGWNITTETVTGAPLPVAAYGRESFLIPTLNLTALSVTVGSVTLVNGTDYAWTPYGLVYRRGYYGSWGYGFGSWYGPVSATTLTYTHGYATTPDAVKSATLQVARRMLLNPGGLFSESVTTGRVTESKSFAYVTGGGPPSLGVQTEDASMLAPYRLAAVA